MTEKLYTITCNRRQLELISKACDFMSRIQILQFDHISYIVHPKHENDKDFKKLHAFQDDLLKLKQYFGFAPNASYGIYSREVANSARILWDVHQVIRNKITYEENPEVTPENRWKKGKITVNFDKPHQSDKENELIKVE